jgi:hypothetical protein
VLLGIIVRSAVAQPLLPGSHRGLSPAQRGRDAPPAPLRLLLQVPYPERIPLLLRQYARLPWTILMAVPAAALDECGATCGAACVCVELSLHHHLDARGAPGCTARMHDLLIAPHADGSSDLLFAHADMWLSPAVYARTRGTAQETVLLPARRTFTHWSCATPGSERFVEQADAWPFWANFSASCDAAIRRDRESGASDGALTQLNKCCYGWSDLLYLPRRAQSTFATLARGAFRTAESHEGSIVTIALALNASGVAPLDTLTCEGDCCNVDGASIWERITQDTLCAHPVDLRDRTGWSRALPLIDRAMEGLNIPEAAGGSSTGFTRKSKESGFWDID